METLNTRWSAPSPSWFKLNFDGTAHSGVAVGGGIIRENLGNLVLAYVGNFGSTSSNMAKALALFWGLKLALTIDAKRLIIEGDSKLIIKVTKSVSGISWMLSNILKDIWSMIVWMEEFHIQHIYREGNSVVDSLTMAGLEMKEDGVTPRRSNRFIGKPRIKQIVVNKNYVKYGVEDIEKEESDKDEDDMEAM
ncbi:uncharacterized protein LOC131874987 [Cryptomeria japonica]|uniref:uncharacterized protein LOC131874987 n=1 Tax=Cryptomeria japonica TaxID=3369 RepID=UPI0027DA6923|nr:uncharacterized protein LOC131874987 [Cryptomeria japonica]